MTRYPIVKSFYEDNFNRNLYSEYFENYASKNIAQISNNLILKIPVKSNPKVYEPAISAIQSLIPLHILIPGMIAIGIFANFSGDKNS